MEEENKKKDFCQNCNKVLFPCSMTMEERYCCSKNYRDVNQQKIFAAERRGCELADEFTRLEVQIAVILFGLVGIFSDSLELVGGGLLLKISYASIYFLLIGSLALGLIHIKRREIFWDDHMIIRSSRHVKWDQAIKRKVSFDEAMAFHEGGNMGNEGISRSPRWTWILQTICLAAAITILLILLLVFLF